MSEVTFKFQEGAVSGGYAFSANSTEITMGNYVESQPAEIQEVLKFEATQARQNYIDTIAAKKAAGEKANPLTIKREAVQKAKEQTKEKFGEDLYGQATKVADEHKNGRLAVSGKSSKASSRKEKAIAPTKVAPKTTPSAPAPDDMDDFDTPVPEAAEALGAMEAPGSVNVEAESDPFADDDF